MSVFLLTVSSKGPRYNPWVRGYRPCVHGERGWQSMVTLRDRVSVPGVRHKIKFFISFRLHVPGRKSDTFINTYIGLIVLRNPDIPNDIKN